MPIVGSPLGSLEPYPELSLAELFFRSATGWSDRVALVDGLSGETYRYAALGGAVAGLGRTLQDDGLDPGDRVAIVAPIHRSGCWRSSAPRPRAWW